MFNQKSEPTFEKKMQDAVDAYGQFVVDEVLRAIELSDSVKSAYNLFYEFDQHQHCEALKIIYNERF
jgi:hypothetical protein